MKVNPLDLSPNYAGSIMAVTNGIGAITGVIAPYVVGVMTPNVRSFITFYHSFSNKFLIICILSYSPLSTNGALSSGSLSSFSW